MALNKPIVDGSAAWTPGGGGPFNGGSFPASRVTDGAVRDVSGGAYWLTDNGQGAGTGYFVLDLEAPTQIPQINLRPTANSSANDRGTLDFQIRGSNNLADVTGATSTAPIILSGTLPDVGDGVANNVYHTTAFKPEDGLLTGAVQYLRFESLTAVNNHGGLGEIMINDDPDNVAFGAPVVDGSGAWTNNAVDDFDANAFAAAHVTDGSAAETAVGAGEVDYWLGRESTADENFVLDLGQLQTISEIHLTNSDNRGSNDRGTNAFTVRGSLDGMTFTDIFSGSLSDPRGLTTHPANIFSVVNGDFSNSQYRFIQFEADTFYGRGAGLAEIAIYIPEPSRVVLLGLGMIGLLLHRHRS